MNTKSVLARKQVAEGAVFTVLTIVAAVLLPQIFHVIGVVSGTGATMGMALLPMHIPVLLAGYLFGPTVGFMSGALSPIVSFSISGMPGMAILPFMVIELGIYGLVSGLISGTKLNSFIQLIIVQIAGRIARAVSVIISICVFGNTTITYQAAYTFIMAGLFGIILQWAVVPFIGEKLKGMLKRYD